jgi:hypothetical protein
MSNGGGLSEVSGFIGNNIIAGNFSERNGGGLDECYNITLSNNTIVSNRSLENGGGIFHCQGYFTNCIIWDNDTKGVGDQLLYCDWPEFSCVQGWQGIGIGNIDENPLFANLGYWDDNGTSDYWEDDT